MTKTSSKILVTGASGFIGLHLSSKLLEHGERDLRCFVTPSARTENLAALSDRFARVHIDILRGDLTSREDAERAVENIDIIYNCAARKTGPFDAMYLNTVVASEKLLEAVVKENKIRRFVHVSSLAVYDMANLPRGAVLNEQTPLEMDPTKRDDPYTYVKLEQEMLIWKYREMYDLPIVVVRPGVVYGPGGDEISRRVGVKLFSCFLNIGGDNILPLSYVDNCADAIIMTGSLPRIEGEVFNVFDQDLCTCSEFLYSYLKKVRKIPSVRVPYTAFWLLSWLIEKCAPYSKGLIPPAFNPYKTGAIWKNIRFDNSKLVEKLGWSQSVSTPDGLKRHFDYYKRYHLKRSGASFPCGD